MINVYTRIPPFIYRHKCYMVLPNSYIILCGGNNSSGIYRAHPTQTADCIKMKSVQM